MWWISTWTCFIGLSFFYKKSSGANTAGGSVTCPWSETVDTQDKFATENKIMPNQELGK